MRVRVYIAGPMTGYKNFNREAFHNAEEELKREVDWPPESPDNQYHLNK
ncbi:hypothetical protein CBL21_22335 [Shigella flexneri]|nr:hypothetical protein CBL21_22335 [Shigella flexneri]